MNCVHRPAASVTARCAIDLKSDTLERRVVLTDRPLGQSSRVTNECLGQATTADSGSLLGMNEPHWH